jgi:putative flippase GtrA
MYLYLVSTSLGVIPSNLIASGLGMLVNFFLQKKFIFKLERNIKLAFVISLASSVVGIGIGTSMLYGMSQLIFFARHQYIAKAVVTGIVFFYNFYMKRYAFERKFV